MYMCDENEELSDEAESRFLVLRPQEFSLFQEQHEECNVDLDTISCIDSAYHRKFFEWIADLRERILNNAPF